MKTKKDMNKVNNIDAFASVKKDELIDSIKGRKL